MSSGKVYFSLHSSSQCFVMIVGKAKKPFQKNDIAFDLRYDLKKWQ